MSLWTIKKRWYSRYQWISRRIIGFVLTVTMSFGPGFPIAAFAEPDTFVGDSAIYIGAPEEKARPKILFLIDNSDKTLDAASGSKYYPNILYEIGSEGREPWDVFKAKATADFETKKTLDNNGYTFETSWYNTAALDNDSCTEGMRDEIYDRRPRFCLRDR